MSVVKKVAVVSAVLGVLAWAGCVARVGPGGVVVGPAPVVVATGYYTPLYYDGYVVYYDEVGRPIYYVGGARYYVPPSYLHYGSLTAHYRRHHVAYRRWYRERGHRHRAYRRPGHRTGRHVRRRGPVRRGQPGGHRGSGRRRGR